MKTVLLIGFLCSVALSYGQIPATGGPPGGYQPHPLPRGMTDAPPIDQSPADAFYRDPKLAIKLQKLLPEGLTIQGVCDGFKKLGDCITTIHASQNLAISLSDLKAKVMGKDSENLDKAIHELKPDVDAKAERKKARKQAEREIPVSN